MNKGRIHCGASRGTHEKTNKQTRLLKINQLMCEIDIVASPKSERYLNRWYFLSGMCILSKWKI